MRARKPIDMHIADCSLEKQGIAILHILNDVIATSTALFDYQPRPAESMVSWFADKAKGDFPVIGAFDGDRLLGFATFGPFRAWPAYKYSVEHSVYISRDCRGKGVGERLLRELITLASNRDCHAMIAGIVSTNAASIALHKKLGFRYGGTVREVGFKFGEWLDLDFYQLLLASPRHPKDG